MTKKIDIVYVHNQQQEVLFRIESPLGKTYATRIIHSLQLSPVIDIYKVVDGKIWGWQEFVQSHNAGLPSTPMPLGTTLYQDPWMIVQGGRHSFTEIYYRVGTAALGKNMLCTSSNWEVEQNWVPLYQQYPHQRLRFFVQQELVGL